MKTVSIKKESLAYMLATFFMSKQEEREYVPGAACVFYAKIVWIATLLGVMINWCAYLVVGTCVFLVDAVSIASDQRYAPIFKIMNTIVYHGEHSTSLVYAGALVVMIAISFGFLFLVGAIVYFCFASIFYISDKIFSFMPKFNMPIFNYERPNILGLLIELWREKFCAKIKVEK